MAKQHLKIYQNAYIPANAVVLVYTNGTGIDFHKVAVDPPKSIKNYSYESICNLFGHKFRKNQLEFVKSAYEKQIEFPIKAQNSYNCLPYQI